MSETKHGPVTFEHISCVPVDPNVFSYSNWGQLVPLTHTNWRDETLSWKENCYIHANLSLFPALIVKGPGAESLLADISVNNYKDWTPGRAKHLIICSHKGNVIDHGVTMRLADDLFEVWCTPFYTMFKAEEGKYEVDLKPKARTATVSSSSPARAAWRSWSTPLARTCMIWSSCASAERRSVVVTCASCAWAWAAASPMRCTDSATMPASRSTRSSCASARTSA